MEVCIPTVEQLKQSWDEQEAKIQLVFSGLENKPATESQD